jgi:hypothetical protein
MTTEQLRKQIHVLDYNLTNKGIEIEYVRYTDAYELGTKKTLWLNPEATCRQLSAIGAISSWGSRPFRVFLSECGADALSPQDWITFSNTFTFCQWEALTLAIRHEMEIELEKDSNLLKMDKAIDTLKNI